MTDANDRMSADSEAKQPVIPAGEISGRAEGDEPSALLGAAPPVGLLLLAIVSIQLGAALATQLFPILGAEGTVAVRILISAILLCLVARGRVRYFAATIIRHWRHLLPYGLCIATMNLFFYQAIDRIPLGAAVTIEFIGPLGVAALGSRKASHFALVGLAALGIFLLSPLSGVDLDPFGMLFALLAGLSWACFVYLSRRVGSRVSGNDGLTIGMTIAAISILPFAIPVIPELVTSPMIFLAAFGVALLSTSLPFTLEFEALKRISTRTYGVLVAVEPAVAALIGAVLLGERIGLQGMIAVACVVVAAIGITIMDARDT